MAKPVVFIAEIVDIVPAEESYINLRLRLPDHFQEVARKLLWLKHRRAVLEISAHWFLPGRKKADAKTPQ